jgi:predicted ATPase
MPAFQPLHNLPASLTPFIGRQGQIIQLHRMVTGPSCRLVTLTGPGGVGKTRLALKVAETALHAFKHGAWLVDLSALSEAGLVEPAAAAVFGLKDVPNSRIIDALRDFFGKEEAPAGAG